MKSSKHSRVFISVIFFLIAGLLAACGENAQPSPASNSIAQVPQQPANVTTAAATSAAPVATTSAAVTTEATSATTAASSSSATPVVATTAAQTVAPVATTSAPGTTNAAATTAASGTTAARTTAPATTASRAVTTAAATTAPARTTAPATTAAPAQAMQIKPTAFLEPMKWEPQTMNNCGPTTAMMVMSYHGVNMTQEQCRLALRPNAGDKNVTGPELVNFIRSKGLKAMLRENGTFDILRALVSNGIPVVTQQWLKEGDDIAHWRVLRGYNVANNTFTFNDSIADKPSVVASMATQAKLWRAFDWRYMPVYKPSQEAIVKQILGEDFDEKTNFRVALAESEERATKSPNDIDMWRNLGYLRYANGDCKGALQVWEQRISKMLKATENGPYNRYLWYQTWPIDCYNTLENYNAALKLIPNVLETTKVNAHMRYQYAIALLGTNKRNDAIAQLKKSVLDDPNYQPSFTMLDKLGVKP
jgi:hypothetical protein